MRLAEQVVDALLERDHMRSLQKSLFARAHRLFDDGFTPDEIFAVVKKQGGLPDPFIHAINTAWAEYQKRGTA